MPPSIVRCEYGAGEFRGVGTRFGMRRAVRIALERDGGHGDHRRFCEPPLQLVVLGLTFAQTEPPAIVVNGDLDVIRIVEGCRAALEGGVVEGPFRRGGSPDQLRELAPVLVITGAAALGGEVVLVPPLQLGLRRQRLLAGRLAADQIAAHRDQPVAALRPERGDDVGGSRSPVEAGHDRVLDPEGVHQGDGVDGQRRLLTIAGRLVREKARRAEAAKIGHRHPVSLRRQQRGDVGVAVDVVRPAVQQQNGRAIRGPGVDIADVQGPGVDLPHWAEGGRQTRS